MPLRRLYVGCALQSAGDEFVLKIRALREELKEHFFVLEFLYPHPGTDQDVYQLDIQDHVANCDLMLAIGDLPSTGLGYELGSAIEAHCKPVLILHKRGERLSRLIKGIVRSNVRILEYSDLSEVKSLLLAFEQEVFSN